MKILINIGHPAHVHLFKNMINNLENEGHLIKIVTRDKDVTLKLLDAYGFEYEVMSGYYNTITGKMYDFAKTDLKLLKIAIKSKPDILIAVGDPYVAHVGKIIRKPSIVFTDTEHAKLANKLTFPFATVICTPSCFKRDLGKKQVRYNGYHELAYLHPNYFKPDASVLDELGLSKDDKLIILRFVSWGASHDIGDRGFTNKKEVINSLERYGRVLITSEAKLPPELEKYKITISPEKIHHLLYFADLYVGESATMASESAMLGTPAIFVSTSRRGYTDELESKYGLVYNFSDPKTMQEYALDKAFELLENGNIKREWREKRMKMLSETIDVTRFMTNFIENYPKSFYEYTKKEEG
jgi:predicted glycosyltransferase